MAAAMVMVVGVAMVMSVRMPMAVVIVAVVVVMAMVAMLVIVFVVVVVRHRPSAARIHHLMISNVNPRTQPVVVDFLDRGRSRHCCADME